MSSEVRSHQGELGSKACVFQQQHLRKWMEVVVITHKGGQRSDGNVSSALQCVPRPVPVTAPHLVLAPPFAFIPLNGDIPFRGSLNSLAHSNSPFLLMRVLGTLTC